MDDKLNFLDGETPAGREETPAAEAPAEAVADGGQDARAPEPPAPDSQPRGPDGKFAARAEAPPEPPRQPPLTEKETVGFYKAMQEERDRRQAAEAKARDLEARLAARQVPPEPPSVDERLYAQNLSVSRRLAERAYGKASVEEVHDWAVRRCEADPIFNQRMRSAEDPYEEAVQAFHRERVTAAVSPDDLPDYLAWKAAKAAEASPSPAQPNPPQPRPAIPPPRSLATAPGNGAAGKAHVPTHEGASYERLFSS